MAKWIELNWVYCAICSQYYRYGKLTRTKYTGCGQFTVNHKCKNRVKVNNRRVMISKMLWNTIMPALENRLIILKRLSMGEPLRWNNFYKVYHVFSYFPIPVLISHLAVMMWGPSDRGHDVHPGRASLSDDTVCRFVIGISMPVCCR